MSGQQETLEIIKILSEESTLEILIAASRERLSAKELSEECNTSLATVYRRINSLLEYNLLNEHEEIDASGNTYKVYETNLKRIVIELKPGYFDVRIDYGESLVDRISRVFSTIGGGAG